MIKLKSLNEHLIALRFCSFSNLSHEAQLLSGIDAQVEA